MQRMPSWEWRLVAHYPYLIAGMVMVMLMVVMLMGMMMMMLMLMIICMNDAGFAYRCYHCEGGDTAQKNQCYWVNFCQAFHLKLSNVLSHCHTSLNILYNHQNHQHITAAADKILEDYQEKANASNFPPARKLFITRLLLFTKVHLALDMHNFYVFLQLNLTYINPNQVLTSTLF